MKKLCLFFALAVLGGPAVPTPGLARPPRPIPVSAHWPFPMVVSPNGRYLATASNGRADAVELYDFKTGRTRILTTVGVNQFYQYQMACYGMAFSPDSRTLAHGGAEPGSYDSVNTWDTATGGHVRTLAFRTVGTSVLFTPDGRNIVAANKDGRVHVWDVKTGQSVKALPGPGGSIVCLALSPDGRRIASSSGGFVQVRDLRSGRAVWTQRVTFPEAEVSSLAFSPDGRTLARGGQNNTIYLHDARTGAVRTRLSDPIPASIWAGANDAAQAVGYSPDGRYLAGGGSHRVVVWSTRTGKVVLRPGAASEPFAFLPDGHTFAATLSDVPAFHRPGSHIVLMRPPRRAGNVSLWDLK